MCTLQIIDCIKSPAILQLESKQVVYCISNMYLKCDMYTYILKQQVHNEYLRNYIFYFGVILSCKCYNQRGNDLMYKILGEEDIFPHSMVSEKWINTSNVFDYNCGYSSNDTW